MQDGTRRYEARDLDGVLALFSRSVRELASRDYTPAQLAAWAPEHPDRDAWGKRLAEGGVFISERGGRLAGFARIADDGCFDLLYVHPEHAGQGVARDLARHVLAWARERGLERLFADVSLTAIPFFERIGFRVIEAQSVERRGVALRNFRMERRGAEP
jgi:putative acetyltransferase